MILIPLMVTGFSIMVVYRVVYKEKKEYLQELSEIQTSFIRSIYKASKDPKTVLELLKNQQRANSILGRTGELIIAYQKSDSAFFMLDHLRFGISNPKPIGLNSKKGAPIQFALKKNTGFIQGLDYNGDMVLAYCDYIPELKWGIVTKIDIEEVNKPFYQAFGYSILAAIILVVTGVFIFRKISSPILNNIVQSENRYRNLFEYAAVPIWEEDFSQVKQFFNQLKNNGISDFRTYFNIHKEEINRLASLVKVIDVNQKSLLFFNVDKKEDLITNLLFYFDDDSIAVFKEEIIALAMGESHFEAEMPIRTITGGKRYLMLHLSVMPGFKESLSKVLVSFIDITQRNIMEQALRESEERFKIIATNTLDNIVIQDSDLRYTSVINPQLGLTEQEMIGKTDYDLLSKEEADNLIKIKKNVLEKGETEFVITPLFAKDGSTQYFEGYYIPKHDTQGQIDGIIGYFRNITEQKRIEDALFRHEATLRGILDATKESIWLFSKDSELLLGNKTALERFGDISGEIIGKHFDEILPAELAKSRMAHLRETFKSGKPLEFEDSRDGIQFFHSFYPVFDDQGKVSHVACYSRDITERKKNEELIAQTQQRLKFHFENSPLAVVEWNSDFIVIQWSGEAERIFGWKASETLGKRIDTLNIIFEEDVPVVNHTMDRLIGGNETNVTSSNRNYTKSGNIIECTWHNSVMLNGQGKMESVLSLVEDITERKKAESEVRVSKEKLSLALENGSIGIWEWNIDTNAIEWDDRMEKIFGFEPGTFGKSYESFENCLVEEDKPHLRMALRNALEKDIPFETIYRIHFMKDGQKYINAKALVNKNTNGTPYKMVGVCFDVTEMKKGTEQVMFKLNEELLRSNKELEQFAYVASHDLQEPLRMVSSFTQLLGQRYKDKLDSDANEYIQYAVDGSKRMQGLINDLLTYSRIQSRGKNFTKVIMLDALQKAVFNLNLFIKEKKAEITHNNLPSILADEGQMVQLLQNLIGNALKFCPDTPKIHIGCEEMKNQFVFFIKDNGIGIESQYFDRIFQIFQRLFPKEEYDGTGIGLAICKRIVEGHDGKIWVESTLGNGSTFYFTILKKRVNLEYEKL